MHFLILVGEPLENVSSFMTSIYKELSLKYPLHTQYIPIIYARNNRTEKYDKKSCTYLVLET